MQARCRFREMTRSETLLGRTGARCASHRSLHRLAQDAPATAPCTDWRKMRQPRRARRSRTTHFSEGRRDATNTACRGPRQPRTRGSWRTPLPFYELRTPRLHGRRSGASFPACHKSPKSAKWFATFPRQTVPNWRLSSWALLTKPIIGWTTRRSAAGGMN